MTGKYPIHTGMQHTVLFGAEPRGLPIEEKLLPQYLEELGYENHIVGKWHLGSYKKEYLPLSRGFKSHLGFWTGHQDYFDHSAMEKPGWGLDMRRNMDITYDLHGQYSTDVFTKESVRLINVHNVSKPLFLYLAHAAVHSSNPYNPLPAPDETVQKFEYIENYERRRFAAMMSKLDDSVGEVVNALEKRKMLNNSIIVFTTDNGGPAAGFNLNAASNYPLKGVKNTLWEGGVRGAAFIWSPLIKMSMRVAKQTMHVADWLPTLVSAASGNLSHITTLDGYDMWDALSHDKKSERKEILHNIDDLYGNAALTIGQWKVVKGRTYDGIWDNWYGPSGRNYTYDISLIFNSYAGKVLHRLKKGASKGDILKLREEAKIECNIPEEEKIKCEPHLAPCLFNIEEDPCEEKNAAKLYPAILKSLEDALTNHNKTAIPPGNLPIDLRGDPKHWNYVWTNFGDYINTALINI